MLAANKVKIHGMKSTRWTIKDKCSQYKGLINLYGRDRVIIDYDTTVLKRKQNKELRRLRKDIKEYRGELENAIKGDRQQLRNTLAEHKQMQLAYQELPPITVADHIHQDNFNKRKELDRLTYKLNQRSQKLIDLILEKAELEDRLKYEGPHGNIPAEKEATKITAKVQDALLKKEAAMAVRAAYQNILDIMKKDAIYFDSVLAALKVDGYNQGKCMIRTTEMGQLATEYLDDRKQEYKTLERAVKIDMVEREKSIKVVREQVNGLTDNLRYLVRRDSESDLRKSYKLGQTISENELLKNVDDIEKTLSYLQNLTRVPNFFVIFSQMEEQLRQKVRLRELVQKNMDDRNTLANKASHAEQLHNSLCHTMVETTFQYKEDKTRLLKEIQEQVERKQTLDRLIVHHGKVFSTVRASLRHVAEMLRNVKGPVSITEDQQTAGLLGTAATDLEERVIKPEHMEEDPLKLIEQIRYKLNLLLSNLGPATELDSSKMENATTMFRTLVVSSTSKAQITEAEDFETSLIEVELEDSKIPTRAEIKHQSQLIVEEFTSPEMLLLGAQKKK